ncbi:hypothetical protein [Streptomyces monashensis]|uniref:hypothetical protein n=1 Tax=Streptomyces monashensis TaxID=1678012 RepID=UPI003F5415F3
MLGVALAPETRYRAAAVAGTIRTDGATVAAKPLPDKIGFGLFHPAPRVQAEGDAK